MRCPVYATSSQATRWLVAFKIATWNINSVRLRMPIVLRYLKSHAPDVLCLQETKCRDGEFPSGDLRAAGYEHIAINGQKGYHGVAIASRHPLSHIDRHDFCAKGDARHIAASVVAGDREITVHNFYVPAGGDVPDPELNPKFAHKLSFLDEMAAWIAQDGLAKTPSILVGDLNIAPLQEDVWNHKALLKVVSHTPVEVERLARVFDAGPWVDALRTKVPEHEKLYTWWSYRSPNWEAANKGRRLDHIWISPDLKSGLDALDIHKEARGWDRPSDHVPVMISLAT
jgi:exodeoxyribonuclease III